MEVYVVRHGETEAGKNKIIADIVVFWKN